MDFFYQYNIIAFVFLNAILVYRQSCYDGRARTCKVGDEPESSSTANSVIWQFKKKFLPVYLLVCGADWLQGPYIYTMYKDQKGLSEETVAYLFTTGFFAAAVSATFVGSLADRYGRRSACLFFCVTYSLSCLSILFDPIIALFLGRILGGLSTTLMYSVFESWMVTEYHWQRLDEAGGSLDDIFGNMTTLNGVVAIIAGLIAQELADFTGTQTTPFMAAILLLALAFGGISKQWNENYGDSADIDKLVGPLLLEKEANGFQYILKDKKLWALCMTSCFFEGTMYLWIFFKFPALKFSRELNGGQGTDLPFGSIFAGLMCSMMLGSLFFTNYSSFLPSRWVIPSSTLLMITLLVSCFCFIIPVIVHDEMITFWCFCVFEICCGIYFPSMAHLKEKCVDDGVRAKIYGFLRVPLNAFVVIGLVLTKDGLRHRENVFMVCSGALAVASAAVGILLQ